MRWFLAALLALILPVGGLAQQAGSDEVRLMRQATLLEAAGDMAAAEGSLRRILDERPASVPALLALERILRHQGRLAELPAAVETALEQEPASAILNQLALRTYSALDRVADLESAAERWMETSPGMEMPYRDAARTWRARGDYARARAALELGRDRVAAPDALALELGALYAELDRPGLAAREWDRAIGEDGQGASQVRRQLRGLRDGGAAVLPALMARLDGDPPTRGRLAAGLELAMTAALEDRSLVAARRLVGMLDDEERGAMLLDLARRADGAGMHRLAQFAYGALLEAGAIDGLSAIQSRYAELALTVGDTAAATAAYADLEGDRDAGRPARRQAAALRVELLAAQDPAAAAESLRAFRDQNPDVAETDELAAGVAEALYAAGRPADAEAALTGVRGPRTALLRGRLALLAGHRDAARSAFMAAAPGLRGGEATGALTLARLLGRISDEGAAALGRALTEVEAGEPGRGIDSLLASVESLEAAERAALLEFAAGLAHRHGLGADADRLRRMVVAEHPRSDEAPSALLALARASVASGNGEEARELLERLIIEYPRSALAPQARRELDRLGRGSTSSNHSSGR